MAEAKMIVMYPRPEDTATFDRAYEDEHIPMALKNFPGLTKFVATKVVETVQGTAPFYRIPGLWNEHPAGVNAAVSPVTALAP
jgi:uncharacterized protein (TIGR02118 family)